LTDPVDRALTAHEAAARALGLCPALHRLSPEGTCPECDPPGGTETTGSSEDTCPSTEPDRYSSSSALITAEMGAPMVRARLWAAAQRGSGTRTLRLVVGTSAMLAHHGATIGS
jgi:hypothetical protein